VGEEEDGGALDVRGHEGDANPVRNTVQQIDGNAVPT
jgi:hypothetical protein